MEGTPPTARTQPLQADDIRGLRRWVVVAGVWAVAATAIALIALLDTSDSDAQKDADATADRLTKVERALDSRLDALEERLDELPQSDDVSKLQGRLARVEKSASDAAESARSADRSSQDLEERISQLEEDSGGDAGADDEQP